MPWELIGNAETNPATDFLGTVDKQPLAIRTCGAERMRVTLDGNIGIGSVIPKGRLHISSDGNWTAPQLHIEQTFQNGWARIRFNKADKNTGQQVGTYWDIAVGGSTGSEVMNFYTQDLNVVTLTHHGDVGIGSSNPDAKLHITSGGNYNSPQLHVFQTTLGDFARMRFNGIGPGDPDKPGSTAVTLPWDIAVQNGVMNFYTEGIGNIMTLKAIGPRGRAGIGTEEPQSELHVEGTAIVSILEITGGSDLAEPFAVQNTQEVEPGSVMVIDDDHPGKLKISEGSYDRKVAGIVSGAGGINAGVTLQHHHFSAGDALIALVGRVYCKAEAFSSPIEPGDFLTTSSLPGYAMKAVDMASSYGAIIGKAMTALPEGTGLVFVLVNLQ